MVQKLAVFCYSFVAGVAGAMIIHPGTISPVTIMTLWSLSGICGVLYILFKRTKYALPLLILTPALFAAANYYRASDISDKNHISHFVDENFFDRTIITGTVVKEPDSRDNKTNLAIKPELIEKPSKSGPLRQSARSAETETRRVSEASMGVIIPPPAYTPKGVSYDTQADGVIKSSATLTGKTGLILVTIYPEIGEFYEKVEYGDKIKVDAALLSPSEMRNPAGFDYGGYLKARGIYAVMYVRRPDMIQYVGPGDTGYLTRLAIKLKRRFLLVIRKTMPYPESAFLAGVTLGSRGGVPQRVKQEFQATGVGHVLAVSGLHVGFVHILLLMFCLLFRIPKKPSWFIIVFGLIIFTIITGASPATRRAALMSSIGQFAYTFGGMGMKMSSAITIPVAAFIILFFDPLLLPEGSFVLSFLAVWSLVYISGPVEDVVRYLSRGWAFLVIILWILLSTGLAILNPDIFLNGVFSVSYVILIILTVASAKIINDKYPLKNFDFVSLPKYFVQFTYAQIAIQIGMMIPLSALFFKMFPVAGMYANYIAIPLIGYIVQLGLIADLFELFFSSLGLAALGLKIAFLINSANYIFSKFFLDMAHFFATLFPYPFVGTPTVTEVILYYSAVMAFVFYKPIFYFLEGVYYQIRDILSVPELRKKIMNGGIAGFIVILTLYFSFSSPVKKLKVTCLDAGFGSSIIIQTPQGKNILIDGGTGGNWDFGTTTLLPTLSKYKIMKLDRLVLTSLETGHIGGLPSVMGKKPVEEVWDVLDPEQVPLGATYKEFLTAAGDWQLQLKPYDDRTAQMYAEYYEFLRAIERNANKNLPKKHYRAKAGDVIYEEKDMKLSVLWPPAEIFQASEDMLNNNSVVLKLVFKKVSFLFASNIKRDAEWALIDSLAETSPDTLKSTVLFAPSHGHMYASTNEFINAVSPETVIVQFGYLKGRSFYESDLNPTFERYAVCVSSANCCRTDKSGSVVIETDGEKYDFMTKLGKTGFGMSAAKGETGDSESLNIGIQ